MVSLSGINCWLFCQVVDNFGDIGVCWRLARQLSTEYGIKVSLWVDDLVSFHKICPQISSCLSVQHVDGVCIRFWEEGEIKFFEKIEGETPDVLIEAFGCHLPLSIQKWAGEHDDLIWFNLEYLSAEDWVDGVHLLPSPQPYGGNKLFFFPGFSEKTGGLLREFDLTQERDQFLLSIDERSLFRRRLLLPEVKQASFTIFIFTYTSIALKKWISSWQNLDLTLEIWLAPSLSLLSLEELFPHKPKVGDVLAMSNLTLHVLPMVSQQEFDKILWLSDINIIRGEDSFVRAHWADKPFFWHIYPQDEEAHLYKLNAFWHKVYSNYSEKIKWAHEELSLELNSGMLMSEPDRNEAWLLLFSGYSLWKQENKKWINKQQCMKSLSENLVKVVKKSLK